MAQTSVPIVGAGSTWAGQAISQWQRDLAALGQPVSYAATGSADGRRQWLNRSVDFAASDVPFQYNPDDGSFPEVPVPGSYVLTPVTAGGIGFAYQLRSNGQRITNLRLSGDNLARIFTGGITSWDDPAIAADNPGLVLPHEPIVPVVQSDDSRPSYELTRWLISQHNPVWTAYCTAAGRSTCDRPTQRYPAGPGMVAQVGELGVSQWVATPGHEGTIAPLDTDYALNVGLPMAKVLNAAGYYVAPTPDSVALALLNADLNRDPTSPDYLTQILDRVYIDDDPRAYPMSSYAYLILRTQPDSPEKGAAAAALARWALCDGQRLAAPMAYAPLPANLVRAGLALVPAATAEQADPVTCNNPTMEAGQDTLLATVAAPLPCDQAGPTQCPGGTGVGPPPVVPEVPWPALLSGSAVVGLGAVAGLRRRRRAPPPFVPR